MGHWGIGPGALLGRQWACFSAVQSFSMHLNTVAQRCAIPVLSFFPLSGSPDGRRNRLSRPRSYNRCPHPIVLSLPRHNHSNESPILVALKVSLDLCSLASCETTVLDPRAARFLARRTSGGAIGRRLVLISSR